MEQFGRENTSTFLASRTGEFGQLSFPITVRLLTERYNNEYNNDYNNNNENNNDIIMSITNEKNMKHFVHLSFKFSANWALT